MERWKDTKDDLLLKTTRNNKELTMMRCSPVAAHNHWEAHQLDVNSVFLNGYLYMDIYIDQPLGYKIKCH